MSKSTNYTNLDVNIFRVENVKLGVKEDVKRNLSNHFASIYLSIEDYITEHNNVVDSEFGVLIERVENLELALKLYGLLK